MKYDLIIIRYGEIALKGKEIRKRFVDTLISNIKNAFKTKNLDSKIIKEWGRIYIFTNEFNKSIDILKKIFGIISISPAYKTKSDLNLISNLVLDICKDKLKENITFAIRTNRSGQHDFSSQDVSIKIGDDVVNNTNAKVNLSKPDFTIFIEIRDDNAYIFTEKIYCTGGLPLGTQGNILSLIDSTISILASWYLMKRGCSLTFVVTQKTNEVILKEFLINWYVKSDIITIKKDNELFDIINKNNFNAMVAGYTLADNPPLIIKKIKKLKKSINLPIFNPLIAMNENEIKNNCKKIGLKL